MLIKKLFLSCKYVDHLAIMQGCHLFDMTFYSNNDIDNSLGKVEACTAQIN